MSGVISAGALAAGGAAYSANKSSKAAGRAADQQKQMQQADLAFRQQQYGRYMGLYGPTEERLAAEARSDQPLDYDQMAAQIKQNYARALRDQSTSIGMRGLAGSGTDIGALRGLALQQAGALSGAYGQGLINRRNLGLNLTGRGQIQQAAGGLMGGMQNMANLYGNQANMYNQADAQGWGNFGQGLQGLAQYWAMQNANQPQPSQNLTNLMAQAGQNVQPVPFATTNSYMPPEQLSALQPHLYE